MPSKKLAVSMVGLLVIQYALGMLANAYSEIPEDKPDQVFHQFGLINIHSYLAGLLLILAVVFLYQATKAGKYKAPAIGGVVNIVLAAVFGHIFVMTQNDVYSILMALAFIGALMSYARIVFTMMAQKPVK